MVKGKEKGNRGERSTAELLGEWIFEDPKFLRRSEGSGSTKIVWCGDVIPVKLLPPEWKNIWPFVVEVKCGYQNDYPDFWTYTKLKEWFIKCIKETKIHNQPIIWLITHFHRKKPLITTNYMIQNDNLMFQICWPVNIDNEIIYAYTYLYKDFLDFEFFELYEISTIVNGEFNG